MTASGTGVSARAASDSERLETVGPLSGAGGTAKPGHQLGIPGRSFERRRRPTPAHRPCWRSFRHGRPYRCGRRMKRLSTLRRAPVKVSRWTVRLFLAIRIAYSGGDRPPFRKECEGAKGRRSLAPLVRRISTSLPGRRPVVLPLPSNASGGLPSPAVLLAPM